MKNAPANNLPPQLSRSSSLWKDAACLLLVLVIGLLALWPYLFTRHALYWGDIELYFAPMQSLLHRSLARGILPLWNPYLLCGEPFVGNPQTWPLYPSTLLAGRLPVWQFLTLSDAIHLLLGGLFFYGFMRGERLSWRHGCVLAALCFMLGGYFVTKTQFPNMAQAIAWVPCLLWLTGRLARAPAFWTAVPLGAALGLQLLAAHAQITLLTGYLALAYALFVAWPRLTGRVRITLGASALREWGKLVGWGVAALALACCLDGGELLPVLEVWKHSDRQVLTLATANRFVLARRGIVGLVAPNAFGSPFDGNLHVSGNYWEPACYLGIVPFALAVADLWLGVTRRTRETIFLGAVFVVSLLLALGRPGLYSLAFYLVPGVKAFHDPARMLLGAAVAGAALAGRGLDWALGAVAARGKQAQIVVAAALIVLTGADLARYDRRAYPLLPVATIDSAVRSSRSEAASLTGVGGRVVYPPDNKATWRYFVSYHDYRRGDPGYLPSLLATRTTDTGILISLADAGGYEPEPPLDAVRRYIDAYNAHENNQGDAQLDALGVDSLIAFKPGGAASSGYFADYRMDVWRNPDGGRVTRARLGDGRYLPMRDVSPDEIVVDVPRGASGEALTIADTDAPGWAALLPAVDAGMTQLRVSRTTNGLSRIMLPSRTPGGTLILRYQPFAWRFGLYLTLLALAFLTGCAVYAVLSRRPVTVARAFKFDPAI